MITQFVNKIEHRPEALYTQADIMARMKRDTLSDVTGWFRTIRGFWHRISVRQPSAARNAHVQYRGSLKQGGQTT